MATEAAAARLAVFAGIAYADLANLPVQRDATANAVNIRGRTHGLMAGAGGRALKNEGAVERAGSPFAPAQGEAAAFDEAIGLTCNRIAALVGAGPDRDLAIDRPTSPCSAISRPN